jgi:hypothetical protein
MVRAEPLEFGHFQSVARSGLKSVAQGLPWVAQGLPWVVLPTRISPEGAMRYGDNRLGTFEPDRVHVSSPFSFRAKRLFSTNPG